MKPEDKDLDALCADAEALINAHDGQTIVFSVEECEGPCLTALGHLLEDENLLPRLLAERRAWKEGRPMEEAPMDGTCFLAEDKNGEMGLMAGDENGFGGALLCPPVRWWPLPGATDAP